MDTDFSIDSIRQIAAQAREALAKREEEKRQQKIASQVKELQKQIYKNAASGHGWIVVSFTDQKIAEGVCEAFNALSFESTLSEPGVVSFPSSLPSVNLKIKWGEE
jgi:hypothetical protein